MYIVPSHRAVYVWILQYWKPQDEVVPTEKGLCLRPLKYNTLKELVPEIGNVLHESLSDFYHLINDYMTESDKGSKTDHICEYRAEHRKVNTKYNSTFVTQTSYESPTKHA